MASDTNGQAGILVRDRQTGSTQRVSVASDGTQGNGISAGPAVSGDGRFGAFWSEATNLVPGDTNGTLDVFVRDRQAGTTVRASVASDGTQRNNVSEYPCISSNGRVVVFGSLASSLVADDTNGLADVFVRDLQASTTERVSVAADGTQGNGPSWNRAVSSDGRFVAFRSEASNLVPADTNGVSDVFVRDRGPGGVGGVAELPEVDAAPLEASGSSGPSAGVVAGIAAGAAAGAVALGGAAWYARRRLRRWSLVAGTVIPGLGRELRASCLLGDR